MHTLACPVLARGGEGSEFEAQVQRHRIQAPPTAWGACLELGTCRISHTTLRKATCLRNPRAHVREERDFPLPKTKAQRSKDSVFG